jgi:hypothetical protein
MMEVTNVLKSISGRAALASVAKIEHTLAQKHDQEGDVAANKTRAFLWQRRMGQMDKAFILPEKDNSRPPEEGSG